jgi:CDGSH-type Zn-finger protein
MSSAICARLSEPVSEVDAKLARSCCIHDRPARGSGFRNEEAVFQGRVWEGQTLRREILCRCGASTNKPICDGKQSRTDFKALEPPVLGSRDRPAPKP